MMKRTISALALAFVASSAFASGTVTVFTQGNSEPKTLTDAERLLDLVGQPRLATSWWPAAVIGEEQATVTARQQQQELLGRLAVLSAEEDGDAAAAINTLRRQIQAVKVTGRQFVNLDPDVVRVSERGNPPLQGHYMLWVGPQPTQVTLFGLISQPGSQPFVPGRDVASYLEDRAYSAARIVAMPGWFTLMDAAKKRRWLTGINVISSRCPAALFLSVLPIPFGAARRRR